MYVLLDIDGVMVPAKSWKTPKFLEDGFFEFSNSAIEALDEILNTGACLLLTSSHGDKYPIEKWDEIFTLRGIETNIGLRFKNTIGLSRKEDVIGWLNSFKMDKYVIIDDDKSLNALPEEIKKRTIITDSIIGLTMEDARKAIEILNL